MKISSTQKYRALSGTSALRFAGHLWERYRGEGLVAWLCILSCSHAGADVFKWKDPPSSGPFNVLSSWANPHLHTTYPGAGDDVLFVSGTYTVTCAGAAAASTEVIGSVTFQLDGKYPAGTYLQGGNAAVVLMGGGTLEGSTFRIADPGSILVDGSGLTMNGFDFGINGLQTRLRGINGAQIKSSSQVNSMLRPRLESGSTWQHTGALTIGRCFVSGGSLLAADNLSLSLAEVDGGRIQAGRLNGGGHAANGATIKADTASLSAWLLEGGGTAMNISGSTVPGLIYADIDIKSGAVFSAGAIADSAWYAVNGNGSLLSVAGEITANGPGKVTVLNQGHGSAGSLRKTFVTVRDAGSLFTYADRAEDATVLVQNGGRMNGGLMIGPKSPAVAAGCSVTGAGSALVLSGNLQLGSSGQGSLNVDSGGQVECALGLLNGGQAGSGNTSSVFGNGSFWLVRSGLIVGDDAGLASLNVGDGARVEVREKVVAVGLQKGSEGRVNVEGGTVQAPSALDTRLSPETGIGVEGKGYLGVRNRGRILTSLLTVGLEAQSTGTLEVIGTGSLETSDTLEIGKAGAGLMTVSAGGVANVQGVLIGSNSGTNLLRLTGSGSTLTVAKGLRVGETGTGRLSIEQGAKAVLAGMYVPEGEDGEVSVGHQPGSTGTVTLSGAGSSMTIPKSLHVGEAGSGALSIEQGARVLMTGFFDASGNGIGQASVGHQSGSSGTATVSGAGSAWIGERGALIVGALGTGTLNVTNGGEVNFEQILIGSAAPATGVAVISGAGSVIRSLNRIRIRGELTVSAGGLVRPGFNLDVNKTGTLRLSGGAAIVGQTSEPAISNTVIIGNQGKFRLGGKLIGSVLLRTGGSFLPGSSPGKAVVEGDLTLAAGTAVELEMAGTGAGVSYDQIEATGTVTLAGRLDFVFRDGFAPVNGQVFELAKGSQILGDFSEVAVQGLAPGFTYSLAKTGGTRLLLTATSTGSAASKPELTINRGSDGSVALSWPGYVTGWTLQRSANLEGSWQPVPAPGNTLTIPAPTGTAFFRLALP